MTSVAAVTVSTAVAQQTGATSSPAVQINAANQLVRNGDFPAAIDQFQQVRAAATQQHTLDYNLAVAQFRNGDIDSAATLFSQSAGSADPAIAARSRYNLGNCYYSRALITAKQEPTTAIEQLRDAISHYRGSLRTNPDNSDARANIELAAELIEQLAAEQEQRDPPKPNQQLQENEQQQDQQQQDQQQQDQQQQDQQQQDQQGQQHQQPDKRDGSSSESQNSAENESVSTGTEDPKNSDSKNQQNAQAEQDQSPPDMNDSRANETDPNQSRRNPSEQKPPRLPDPNEQPASGEVDQNNKQPVPTGELTPAQTAAPKDQPAEKLGLAGPHEQEGMMTREEALKMLQAVRDRDMLRRMQQKQRERTNHIPVDKDW